MYVADDHQKTGLQLKAQHEILSTIDWSCRTTQYKYVNSFPPFFSPSENNLGNTNLYVLFKALLNNAWYIAWLDSVCMYVCARVYVCLPWIFLNWLEDVAPWPVSQPRYIMRNTHAAEGKNRGVLHITTVF